MHTAIRKVEFHERCSAALGLAAISLFAAFSLAPFADTPFHIVRRAG